MDCKILAQSRIKIVYRVRDLDGLDESSVGGLDWPDGLKARVFVPDRPPADLAELAGRFSGGDRVWLMSMAGREDIFEPDPCPEDCGMASEPLLDRTELKGVFLDTFGRCLAESGATLTCRQAAEQQRFISDMLPESRHLHVAMGGRTAGLLLLNGHHDYLGEPADLIPWAWVDARLRPAERVRAITLMCGWLRSSVKERVQDFSPLRRGACGGLGRLLGLKPHAVYVVREQ